MVCEFSLHYYLWHAQNTIGIAHASIAHYIVPPIARSVGSEMICQEHTHTHTNPLCHPLPGHTAAYKTYTTSAMFTHFLEHADSDRQPRRCVQHTMFRVSVGWYAGGGGGAVTHKYLRAERPPERRKILLVWLDPKNIVCPVCYTASENRTIRGVWVRILMVHTEHTLRIQWGAGPGWGWMRDENRSYSRQALMIVCDCIYLGLRASWSSCVHTRRENAYAKSLLTRMLSIYIVFK